MVGGDLIGSDLGSKDWPIGQDQWSIAVPNDANMPQQSVERLKLSGTILGPQARPPLAGGNPSDHGDHNPQQDSRNENHKFHPADLA